MMKETNVLELQAQQKSHGTIKKVTIMSFIMTLGIVYGDIGTSPLYVMSAILRANGGLVELNYVLGGVSLVIWTLTLQTTIKYVLLILSADNNGEGGILSLYTLVRKKGKHLLIPAIIGSAALLADSVITPPVTVSSAIEGLHGTFPITETMTIMIVAAIITGLFLIQRFGTEKIGRVFGSVMLFWFGTLALIGVNGLSHDFTVLRALNPMYALQLLFNNPVGILILGAVFLCTTGAEALYSDLGHCGKKNIYYTWVFVKTALVLNYLGQAAVLLQHEGSIVTDNPFFMAFPPQLKLFGVILSTFAAIIASQSLISGSFTLVSEAIKLNIFPRLEIKYPTNIKGQVYIPAINTLLWMGTMFVLFHFKKSENMEAAYGLSITIAMLMTTILYFSYLRMQQVPKLIALVFLVGYIAIEGSFLYANLFKFVDGGYITVLIGVIIMLVMYIWIKGRLITHGIREGVELKNYIPNIEALQENEDIPIYTANVVLLTKNNQRGQVERKLMHALLNRRPKKANVYWFVNVEETNDPFGMNYTIDTIAEQKIFKINLKLGFRIERRVSYFVRQIIEKMLSDGELQPRHTEYQIDKNNKAGDISFILMEEVLLKDTELSELDTLILQLKLFIKKHTVTPAKWFCLEPNTVKVVEVPLMLPIKKVETLTRIRD